MHDPVLAADGFSYERTAIEDWFAKGHRTSPKTGVCVCVCVCVCVYVCVCVCIHTRVYTHSTYMKHVCRRRAGASAPRESERGGERARDRQRARARAIERACGRERAAVLLAAGTGAQMAHTELQTNLALRNLIQHALGKKKLEP